MTVMMDPIDQVVPGRGPGWGIAADLTPPEVTERRKLKGLRRAVVAGVALTLMLCVGAFAFTVMQARSAEESLARTQDRTNALTAQQSQYRDVITIQASTRALDAQIAELMKADVDVATVAQRFRDTLPGSMSLTSINVALDTASGAAPAPTDAAAPAQAAGKIGTVTLSGTSQKLSDLAVYVSNIQNLDGVVNVLPSSNTAAEGGAASWTVTLDLTDALHSHRYDVDGKDR